MQNEQDDLDEDEARERRWRLAAQEATVPDDYEAVDADAVMQQQLRRKLARLAAAAPAPMAAAAPRAWHGVRAGAVHVVPAEAGSADVLGSGTEKEALAAAMVSEVRSWCAVSTSIDGHWLHIARRSAVLSDAVASQMPLPCSRMRGS